MFLKKIYEKGVTDQDLYYLSTPSGKRTLDAIAGLIEEMRLEYEEDRFFFEVNYERDLLDLIQEGHYVLVNNLCILERIPIRELGSGEKEIFIFTIKEDLCTHDVITQIGDCGFHPAGLVELLHFRLNIPDSEITKVVVINPLNNYGVQYCSVVYKNNARIFLDLAWFHYEGKWPKGTKFMVHKQNLFAIP